MVKIVPVMKESNDPENTVTMYEACLLHTRADRTLRLILAKELEQFDITMMEWLLLGTVQQGPKEGVNMSSLASTLDVTLPQVTALTTGLLKQKLVKQKISRQDRRSRRLIITNAGKKLLSAVEDDARDALREWVSGIPDSQLQAYLKTEAALANKKPSDEE